MQKILRCLILALLTAPAFTHAQQADNPASDQAVIATMRAIRAAGGAGDKQTWNRLVAVNCSFVEPSGIISSRASHEPRATSGPALDNKLELSNFVVHTFGDTAVLTYRQDQTVKVGDNTTHSATRYTETYKRSGESWQMIFSAETPIPLPSLIKVDSKVYDDYAGEYEIAPQLIGTVYRDGDRLMLMGTGWKTPYELLPVAPDTFVVKGMEQNEIAFVRDQKGKVTHQSSKYRGQQQAMAKKIK
jgi:hypothetical protein